MADNRFFPDIDEYLGGAETSKSVSLEGLDDIVNLVASRTNLSLDEVKTISKLFFQEILNQLLIGNEVVILSLGKFFVACPKNETTKRKVFAKFEPYKDLLVKINDGRFKKRIKRNR